MKQHLRKLFCPGIFLTAVVDVIAVILLTVVLEGRTEHPVLVYGSYLLSTYGLVITCRQVPAWLKTALARKNAIETVHFSNPSLERAASVLLDPQKRPRFLLLMSLIFNLVYAAVKLTAGWRFRSWWMISLGLYYALLSIMRFMLTRRMGITPNETADRKLYGRIGSLLLILIILLSGIITLTILIPETYAYPGTLVYAFALYAFIKIISSCILLIRKRTDESCLFRAARCITFACALMSIYALQTALISQFGEWNGSFAFVMKAVTGAVICFLVDMMAVYMIVVSRRTVQK